MWASDTILATRVLLFISALGACLPALPKVFITCGEVAMWALLHAMMLAHCGSQWCLRAICVYSDDMLTRESADAELLMGADTIVSSLHTCSDGINATCKLPTSTL